MKKFFNISVIVFSLALISCYRSNISELSSNTKEIIPLEDLHNGQYLIASDSNNFGSIIYTSIKYYCNNGYKVITISSKDESNCDYIIFEKIK